jgi:hypothetical protein
MWADLVIMFEVTLGLAGIIDLLAGNGSWNGLGKQRKDAGFRVFLLVDGLVCVWLGSQAFRRNRGVDYPTVYKPTSPKTQGMYSQWVGWIAGWVVSAVGIDQIIRALSRK